MDQIGFTAWLVDAKVTFNRKNMAIAEKLLQGAKFKFTIDQKCKYFLTQNRLPYWRGSFIIFGQN